METTTPMPMPAQFARPGTAAAPPLVRGGGPADYFAISPDNGFKIFRPRRARAAFNRYPPS